MNLTIETEQEDDGRWIAEIPELSGVLAYGATRDEAMARAEILALRVLAERSSPLSSCRRRPAPTQLSASEAAAGIDASREAAFGYIDSVC